MDFNNNYYSHILILKVEKAYLHMYNDPVDKLN